VIWSGMARVFHLKSTKGHEEHPLDQSGEAWGEQMRLLAPRPS